MIFIVVYYQENKEKDIANRFLIIIGWENKHVNIAG
jgi:hypothetical protein